MPNWVTNTLNSSNLGKVIRPYLSKQPNTNSWYLDFEKVIPMPYGIKVSHELASMEMINLAWKEKEVSEKLQKYLSKLNKDNYKESDWYGWSVSNWGTKWNISSCVGLDDVEIDPTNEKQKLKEVTFLEFQTAWSPPYPIIRELHKLTGIALEMVYLDEGWMFGGRFTIDKTGAETDECYDDPKDVPKDSELYELLDCEYILECREEQQQEECNA